MMGDLNSDKVKPAKLIELENSANRFDLAWNLGLFENKLVLLRSTKIPNMDLEGIDLNKTVSFAESRGVQKKERCS